MLASMLEVNMADEIPVPEAFHAANAPEPIKADTVELNGSVQQVEARVVNVTNGGIGAAKGEVLNVTVKSGGIGAMAGKRVDVHVTDGGIGAMAAQEVTLSDQTSVAVMAALKVNGSPKVMFDLRAGVVAGVVAGMVFGLINLLGRRRH
jgi:hypothetical protein